MSLCVQCVVFEIVSWNITKEGNNYHFVVPMLQTLHVLSYAGW